MKYEDLKKMDDNALVEFMLGNSIYTASELEMNRRLKEGISELRNDIKTNTNAIKEFDKKSSKLSTLMIVLSILMIVIILLQVYLSVLLR